MRSLDKSHLEKVKRVLPKSSRIIDQVMSRTTLILKQLRPDRKSNFSVVYWYVEIFNLRCRLLELRKGPLGLTIFSTI